MLIKIYIGCSGWTYREWQGQFYPQDLSSSHYFNYYIQHFSTVEVNSTFYRFPTLKTLSNWAQKSPKGFKYTLKVNRVITHSLKFKESQEWIKKTYGMADILQEKMGCFLFQLPPSFTFSLSNLEIILANLNSQFNNVLEFRHQSWWQDSVLKACKAAKVTLCSVSGMGVPEGIIGDQDKLYIRFHGSPTYDINYEESTLKRWATYIHNHNPKEIWIYFNNTRLGHAPFNALYLKSLLCRTL